MKNILVPVEEHAFLPQVLETALLLAQEFGSYVEGLPVIAFIPDAMPAEMVVASTPMFDPIGRADTALAYRHHFESLMAQGAPMNFGWFGDELKDDSFVGEYARTFDITVVGRPSKKPNQPRIGTVEAALFESGRPVLVVPPTAPGSLGKSILIAWNRSTETARTVALGLPLLQRAERVIVLEVAGWGADASSGADLVRSLRRHGVAAQLQTAQDAGSAGKTVLAAAATTGCDLLFKGAYTVSRLRQMIFGGPTTHILAHAELPVFMAH